MLERTVGSLIGVERLLCLLVLSNVSLLESDSSRLFVSCWMSSGWSVSYVSSILRLIGCCSKSKGSTSLSVLELSSLWNMSSK
jgi:hypothetical protein